MIRTFILWLDVQCLIRDGYDILSACEHLASHSNWAEPVVDAGTLRAVYYDALKSNELIMSIRVIQEIGWDKFEASFRPFLDEFSAYAHHWRAERT